MKILMTGGTGFLGRYILEDLISHCEILYLLVRKKSFEKAKGLFSHHKNVILISGDLENMDLIEGGEEYHTLKNEIDTILHVAAYYDIEGKMSECYVHNVVGTQNLLYFANQCSKLEHFHYISTIAVSGSYHGRFYEESLDYSQGFTNPYSQTKYFAEFQVKNWTFTSTVKKRIYRLGILVGDSLKGETLKIDGPYYFTEFLLKNIDKKDFINLLPFLPIPYDKKTLFPLIPVDHAKDYILQGILKNPSTFAMRTYHVIGMTCPTIENFLLDCFETLGIKSKPFPLPNTQLSPFLVQLLGMPQEVLHYMYSDCIYDQRCFKEDLASKRECHYEDYKDILFTPLKERGGEDS